MKRFYFLAASIGFLAACSEIEQDFADVNRLSEGDLVEKVVFEVLPIKDGDNSETRASAVPSGGNVSFAWEENDMIGIYPNKGSQIYFTIDDGAGSSSASFDGGGWALKQDASYVSYYPFVADFFLSRDAIPVSFEGQKQVGTESPFNGARYFLASETTSSENGVLRFSYNTLNTIINVNATLPAGTYTKASLTIEEPLFVEEGSYSLDDRVIVGTKFSNTLEIELEDVTLTEQTTIPIYIMSAPVDLKGKEVTVRIISSEGQHYECIKTPSKAYEAGTRYGLTCDQMVQSNVVFDDENFKAYCVERFDSDGDGDISCAEAKVVTYIDVSYQGISSLKGIEHFTSLTRLSCQSNQLTSLDMTKNIALAYLDCYGNQLTSLDVSQNTALKQLSCGKNQLTSLDVSQNTALKQLRCHFNQLTSLDVSNNTALEVLYCYNNQLTSLDVSQNTALESLDCSYNQLTSLDVSENSALKELSCERNQLTYLDVSHNTALTSLVCSSNPLTRLDVSHNTALTTLECEYNQLTSLDISHNTALTRLFCSSNQLTVLDVSEHTALVSLACTSNQLMGLDVSQNTALEALMCDSNQLISLYVSHNTALVELYCNNNRLTSLDVSQNTALKWLYCQSNQLTSLDVSHNTALYWLACTKNRLTSLDVSQNTALTHLDCYNNPTLTDIWLKNGQIIQSFSYDTGVATIKFKD